MSRVYVALDIEATGLSVDRDAIIEIGAVKFRDDEPLGEWSTLVNPGRPVPFRIQQLTGITDNDLRRAPNLNAVRGHLERFVGGVPVVGHSIGQDLGYLARAGIMVGHPCIDTFELASILVPYASRYNLATLMAELGMAGGRLEVALESTAGGEPHPQGSERVEFLVSANPGQAPRPLRKVASGGELARISLAIEVAALGSDAIGTMVFDEVDAGIGGAVAEIVGHKLRALGDQRQVLCVTHLPQVAAQGHAHLRVAKASDGATTHTRIDTLDAAAREEEIARMLGGVEISRETRAHARQMLGKKS